MAISWDWMRNLYNKSDIDHFYRGYYGVDNGSILEGPTICEIENITGLDCIIRKDRRVCNYTIQSIESLQTNLMFIHFGKLIKVLACVGKYILLGKIKGRGKKFCCLK